MTLRLALLAMQEWTELDGYAVAHGMPDLRELPLGRFCNFVWYMVTRNKEQTEVEKFRAKVWMPPPHSKEPIDERSPWSPQKEMEAFRALRAQISG